MPKDLQTETEKMKRLRMLAAQLDQHSLQTATTFESLVCRALSMVLREIYDIHAETNAS